MKYFLTLSILCFVTNISIAQNRQEAIKKNKVKLVEIAEEYIIAHPEDQKAIDLQNKLITVNSSYVDYLNKLSGGNYEHFGTKGQVEYEALKNNEDPKASAMATVVGKTFNQHREYLMGVSIPYRNQLTNFQSSLRSGMYGKRSDVIRKKRKRG